MSALTSSGSVSAGSIRYILPFTDCDTCPSAAGVTGLAPVGSVNAGAGDSP